MEALSQLLDRKPHLWQPIAKQLLPPPLTAVDPAERLGIDLSAWRTADDCGQVMATVLAAIARGESAPAEAAHIAERADTRLRAARCLARLERRPAHGTGPLRTPPG